MVQIPSTFREKGYVTVEILFYPGFVFDKF